MPKMIMLIGMPGSGKSTWCKILHPNTPVVSSDAFIEEYANSIGKTYDEVFSEKIKEATKHVNFMVDKYVSNGIDFIWDQTNLTRSSRKNKLSLIPKEWTKIAYYFDLPPEIIWRQRLKSRVGKTIPDEVLHKMKIYTDLPSLDEGFKEIHYIGDDFC